MPRIQNIPEYATNLDGKGLRVGIVMSRFNIDVCEGLLSGTTAELLECGVAPDAIQIATVPGALEIPLVLQTMAKTGKYDALVALGAGIPIANGVLTTEDDDQALSRMSLKGKEAAQAAIEMANLLRAVKA